MQLMMEKLIDKTNSDWKNIYIISIFAFIDASQFSFFVWSFWPYAQQLDSTLSPSFIGIIMALSGVGEALFAPIFGYWANRIGHINPPLISSLLISLIGNAMYMCMSLVPIPLRPHALLISRFFSGAGSANRGTYLAYVASASLEKDRTKSMALAGGGALIGLVGGPSIQAAFTWIGSGWDFYGVRISMYTAPAILAMFVNVSCILLLVLCFDDGLDNRTDPINISTTSIPNSEDSRSNSIDFLTTQISQYDLLAVLVCMTTRSARMFVTSNVESIGSPYSQLMFNFDDTEVLYYNSLIQTGIGFLTTVMLIIYASTSYTEKVSERANVIGAMFALLVFHLVTFSWSFLPGTVNCSNLKINGLNEWCQSLKPVNLYIYYGSYVLVFGIALPCLNNSLQSLYSLVLGKGRQGTMQGINQAVGSLSRILGPIVMSSTFTNFGPQATWGVEIVMLTLFILIWMVTFRRLVPATERQRKIFLAANGVTCFIGSNLKIFFGSREYHDFFVDQISQVMSDFVVNTF